MQSAAFRMYRYNESHCFCKRLRTLVNKNHNLPITTKVVIFTTKVLKITTKLALITTKPAKITTK